jgi:hypothetical protein
MPQLTPDGRRDACESADRDEQALTSLPDESALDAAVRATLESADGDQQITAEEIGALREVARRLGATPLSLDPVAVELVEAIINVNYGQLHRSPEVWHAVAVRIATVLYESPAARTRLENLWLQLIESHGCDA